MAQEKKTSLSWSEAFRRTRRVMGIWWRICPNWFWATGLYDALTALAPYVAVWFSARLIGELSGERDPETLGLLALGALLSGALLSLATGAAKRWRDYENQMSRLAYKRLQQDKMLDMDFVTMDRQETADLYSQILQNVNWSGKGLLEPLVSLEKLMTALVRILGGVGLSVTLFLSSVPEESGMTWLNHPLCVLGVLVLLLLGAVTAPALYNRGDAYWVKYAESILYANRAFRFYGYTASTQRGRAEDARMYRQREQVSDPLLEQTGEFGPHSLIARWARGPMGACFAASQSVSAVLTGLVYGFVCLKSWAGAFGVGSIVQYVGAITNLFLGLSELLEGLGELRVNAEDAFLGTEFRFLDLPHEMYRGSLTTEKRADRQYQVEFRDVSFRYPGTERYALRHVSMTFRVGRRLAEVGPNGSGKTTFIKLLCRLYDPTEGEILLNGIDIRKYRYEDYIALFSVVFQDFQLFALPLGQNVAGAVEYDRERARHALEDAGFDRRLETMSQGLDTCLYKDLDKDGVEVSGGEAQKIAIARALYKDAPFIVLDEPTAALDPMAEAEIYSKFNDIAGDKTAVYISHRLSSCKFCDQIAVFQDGAVVQTGSHEALLADEDGLYARLWNAQAQYYVKEKTGA
ncbi:MAG: ABC transporter ATP-binding protein/permease [Clostridiales bacterium]|nr:ABC transporter ATP-binding protein/permease [Clostridiales bacterium]